LVGETVGQAYAGGTPFAFEHRVPLPGGRVRWISSRGRVVTDDAGTPVRMLGTAQDVTERKLQEAELERLNAELQARLEDLAASRARIVAAGDVERRRLERNLHDGAQQRLVSLALSLRVALDRLDRDPDAARQLLDRGAEELAIALEELRELARGLHPALLTDRGLGAALKSLARSIPVRVEIVETPGERLAEPIEVAAYYLIAEALTNVAKYAQATTARVQVVESGHNVVVEVRDDGIGGAHDARGSGLQGLADRVEALGGRLELTSPVGAGTTVRAEIPARAEEVSRHQRKELPAGLTAREVDVLRLIAVGLTDAAAADRLFLSVRTVNAHLRSIYRKLGVSSRAAAGRFAQSTGLL
jgi:signal transduction histidine kinase/DNA-binding CsgD family transcriptional regulator